jgi:hypothetical protein
MAHGSLVVTLYAHSLVLLAAQKLSAAIVAAKDQRPFLTACFLFNIGGRPYKQAFGYGVYLKIQSTTK